MTDAAPPTPARDTPKSQRTRARILDCAMKLFAEIGYAAATNPRIAEEAGLTRGAMLYHFPTREALVDAAVGHIQAARLALLSAAADQGAPGGDVADQAIDSYWAALQSTPFKAFAELEAAARLDADVRQRIAAAQSEFDHAQVGEPFARMISTGAGARFQASRDLARFMLEGLARAELTYDRDTRIEHLLAVIKRATHILNRKGPPQDLWPE
ncbi:TetR/AcrR family transcriptional regulator [Phenylobacterium montanum]|nr:TetR/AcrR family transcriptional regulator [Caulobacter sp. S6]